MADVGELQNVACVSICYAALLSHGIILSRRSLSKASVNDRTEFW
jgi:hypothetical protein